MCLSFETSLSLAFGATARCLDRAQHCGMTALWEADMRCSPQSLRGGGAPSHLCALVWILHRRRKAASIYEGGQQHLAPLRRHIHQWPAPRGSRPPARPSAPPLTWPPLQEVPGGSWQMAEEKPRTTCVAEGSCCSAAQRPGAWGPEEMYLPL